MSERLLSLDDLREKKGVVFSHTHIYRLIRTGKFPRPVKLGENRNVWIEAEIDAWVKAKIAERDVSAEAA